MNMKDDMKDGVVGPRAVQDGIITGRLEQTVQPSLLPLSQLTSPHHLRTSTTLSSPHKNDDILAKAFNVKFPSLNSPPLPTYDHYVYMSLVNIAAACFFFMDIFILVYITSFIF
jgi:hypothetical protein